MKAPIPALSRLAIEVSTLAPEKQHPAARGVLVPIAVLEDIRANMEAAGYDWRQMCRNYRKARKQMKSVGAK